MNRYEDQIDYTTEGFVFGLLGSFSIGMAGSHRTAGARTTKQAM